MKTLINTRLSINRFESRRNHTYGGREPPENDEKGNRNGGFERFAEKLKNGKMLVFVRIFCQNFPHIFPIFFPTFKKQPNNKKNY